MFDDRSFLLLMLQILDIFPGEFRLIPSEVSPAGSLPENGCSQFQLFHQYSRPQVEIPVDDSLQILVSIP